MKTQKTETELSLHHRKAGVESYDEKTRSAEMIFASSSPVKRFDSFGDPFFEVLSVEQSAMRTQRLDQGAVPFLQNHGSVYGPEISDVLGRVQGPIVFGLNEVKAKVRFGERPEIQGLIKDIVNGTIRNVSVGYRVHRLEKVGEQDGVDVMLATDWEPLEVSAVAIGADPVAGFRNENNDVKYRCEVIRMSQDVQSGDLGESLEVDNQVSEDGGEAQGDLSECPKTLTTDQTIGETQMDETKVVEAREEALAEGRKAERERIAAIRKAVSGVKLEDAFAERLIDADYTLERAHEAIITELSKRDHAHQTRSVRAEAGDQDERKTRFEGASEALLARANPGHKEYPVTEKARQWMNWSLSELAREFLTAEGVNVRGMSRHAVVKRAFHSSSDFPELLAQSAGKRLRSAYSEAPQTFQPFTRRVMVPDFKEQSRIQLGDAPSLEFLPEGGEIKAGTIGEAAEKYSVKEYAKMLTVSRQMIVNDDLSAFNRIPELMGRAARDLETELAWGQLVSNPVLADGVALFHASHANLGTAAVISDTTLGEFRQLMRKQLGLNGRLLNLQLQWLAVPAELETVAEKNISSIQPLEVSKVNPFGPQGRTPLQLIVEPRLATLAGGSATAYYGMASLGQIDMVEMAMIEGLEGPEVSTEEVFESTGMKIRVVHAVAAKVLDHRGLVKNAGA